ncbi:MAG: hypothetical protein ACXAC5_03080 [Promethearchaeota archaeon]
MRRLLVVMLSLFAASAAVAEEPPQFTLAWSEYPSWSTFGVSSEVGFINGKAGELGEFEKKHNVDLVLKLADYDTCLVMYGSNKTDMICITNMDVLNPSRTRNSVAFMPTSTSNGADALIVRGNITSLDQLKGKRIYGLSKTVSEYMFARNVEMRKGNLTDFNFTNMDPAAAATALQQGQENVEAIAVWNPFALQTLNQRPDARVLFDSTSIPGEIIDMVVIGEDALNRPGGDRAAKAVCETFYRLNKRLANSSTRDDTLIALGEKFANLTLKQMRQCVRQTRFYDTPKAGIGVFTSADLPSTMSKVVGFCERAEIIPPGKKPPSITYGSAKGANLRFDPQFMQAVSSN